MSGEDRPEGGPRDGRAGRRPASREPERSEGSDADSRNERPASNGGVASVPESDAGPDPDAEPADAGAGGSPADPRNGADDGADRPDRPATGAPGRADGDGAEFETGPSSIGVALTVAASLAAVVPLAGAPMGLGAGLFGAVLVGAGVRIERSRAFGLGVVALGGGVLLAGLSGAAPWVVVAATAGTLLAWDVGDTALVVGEQLGRAAPTARLELVHATATAIVLAVGAGVAYAVFYLMEGGRPTLALALLLLGATLLAATLR